MNAGNNAAQKAKKQRVVTEIVIGDDKYDFSLIKQRTVYAPDANIEIDQLLPHNSLRGLIRIDNSEIRVCRINKKFVVLSGFSKILELIAEWEAQEVKEGPCIIPAKVMSKSYLDSTLIVPPKPTIEEKLKSAGFNVSVAKNV